MNQLTSHSILNQYLKFIESLPHDRGYLDRAIIIINERHVWQRYFTEIEVEFEKIGQNSVNIPNKQSVRR